MNVKSTACLWSYTWTALRWTCCGFVGWQIDVKGFVNVKQTAGLALVSAARMGQDKVLFGLGQRPAERPSRFNGGTPRLDYRRNWILFPEFFLADYSRSDTTLSFALTELFRTPQWKTLAITTQKVIVHITELHSLLLLSWHKMGFEFNDNSQNNLLPMCLFHNFNCILIYTGINIP